MTHPVYKVMVADNGKITGTCQGYWLNKVVAERKARKFSDTVRDTHPHLSYVVVREIVQA